MKQTGAAFKVFALVLSVALAAGYVAYRVAGAKSGDGAAPPKATPATPGTDDAGEPTLVVPAPVTESVPMMGGSKSLAPLLSPKDLEPKEPPAQPPTPTSPPTSPR